MELKSGTKLKGRTFGLEYQAAKVRNTIKLRRNRKKCGEKLKSHKACNTVTEPKKHVQEEIIKKLHRDKMMSILFLSLIAFFTPNKKRTRLKLRLCSFVHEVYSKF